MHENLIDEGELEDYGIASQGLIVGAKKWGKKPHRSQPDLDLAKTA